jgi:hypothetical protein
MGDSHDRQETLSFAHEVWRVESELKTNCTEIYDKLIRQLMPMIYSYYWQKLHLAHDENGQLRFIGECKRKKDKVLIRPEVEYIVYDADEATRTARKLPHIGPHTDNSSVVTLVCLLSNPNAFEGGINYFCPGGKGLEPRRCSLKQGDVVLFRGERCVHWISDVTKGRRAILQIELALCAGTHDTPISSEQAASRTKVRGRQKGDHGHR